MSVLPVLLLWLSHQPDCFNVFMAHCYNHDAKLLQILLIVIELTGRVISVFFYLRLRKYFYKFQTNSILILYIQCNIINVWFYFENVLNCCSGYIPLRRLWYVHFFYQHVCAAKYESLRTPLWHVLIIIM